MPFLKCIQPVFKCHFKIKVIKKKTHLIFMETFIHYQYVKTLMQ